MNEGEVILSVEASPMRRWIGVGSLAALGGLLLWIAFMGTASILWVLGLMIGAGISLWGAARLYQSTAVALELTEAGIRTAAGEVLVSVGDIAKIDRGAFAFKPSNGFLVRLKSPAARGWAPGLWWRSGTYLGIGGVLPPGETRAMAELLKAVDDGDLPVRQ